MRIFVLWHPGFKKGAEVASAIFRWFRTPDGHGIPVYYRSNADPNGGDGLPPPIPLEPDVLTLVIILAEVQMVRDRVWRNWLSQLADPVEFQREANRAQTAPQSIHPPMVYPVSLDSTAYKLPGSIRALNFISPRSGQGRGADIDSQADRELLPKLLKSLTDAFARVLGPEFGRKGAKKFLDNSKRSISYLMTVPPKMKVFISHAKRDGTDVAKRLRDYLYQETQLSAFFDENDIALGYKFSEVLNETLESDTAAMIVVNSDRYAERPWCRREVEIFGRPKPSLAYDGVWEKPPILVVQSMNGGHVSTAVPEFGNAPMIRWREGDEAFCVDTLLRETIFRSYHSALAGSLREELRKERSAQNRLFLNWAPDPLSLETAIREFERRRSSATKTPRSRNQGALEVFFPGRGLSAIENQVLTERFPGITLTSFHEARRFA